MMKTTDKKPTTRKKLKIQTKAVPFSLEFSKDGPDGTHSQDKEWCVVKFNGTEKRIRFHDYHEIYVYPGLYEHIFYEKLKCNSPEKVCGLLRYELQKAKVDPSKLNVLELGSGNGMVAERLQGLGIRNITGIDIIEEALQAAYRDRPRIYKAYYVADLTDLDPSIRIQLEAEKFNALVTVAALGFGDIPVRAFAEAFNMISKNGWVAMNIKETFLNQADPTGFAGLIRKMFHRGIIRLQIQERYRHRFSTSGESLHYMGLIAVKLKDIPEELIVE